MNEPASPLGQEERTKVRDPGSAQTSWLKIIPHPSPLPYEERGDPFVDFAREFFLDPILPDVRTKMR